MRRQGEYPDRTTLNSAMSGAPHPSKAKDERNMGQFPVAIANRVPQAMARQAISAFRDG
jgi:hypothetical protein